MTPDEEREMLEMAAKAHGYVDDAKENTAAFGLHRADDGEFYWIDSEGWTPWNPRQDDGQALRLAIELGLEVGRGIDGSVYAFRRHDISGIGEELGADKYAATRLAITRAAAAIGRNMKD